MTISWLVKCSHKAEEKILTDLLELQDLFRLFACVYYSDIYSFPASSIPLEINNFAFYTCVFLSLPALVVN